MGSEPLDFATTIQHNPASADSIAEGSNAKFFYGSGGFYPAMASPRISTAFRFGNFIDTYKHNIAGANEAALNASVIGMPFIDFMASRASWERNASQLLAAFTAATDETTTNHPYMEEFEA